MVARIGQRFDLVQPTVPEGGKAMQQDGLQARRIRSALLRCNRSAAQSKSFNSVVTGGVEGCKGRTDLVSGLSSRQSAASPGFASAPLLELELQEQHAKSLEGIDFLDYQHEDLSCISG